jgi:nicotinamidase-related amidase
MLADHTSSENQPARTRMDALRIGSPRGDDMPRARELPLPDFYRPEHAGRWAFRPDPATLHEAAVAWRREHDLQPSRTDPRRIHLLLVDLQKDFCHPEGSLYVGGRSGLGAVEDSDRTARFIYRNLGVISDITCTMDTHYPYQIFSPSFWLDERGEPPAAHTVATAEDVESGRLRPHPAVAEWLGQGDAEWLRRQTEHYCRELERTGRYTLYLWPPHCLLGSDGHALAGVIQEARLFHAHARLSQAAIEVKGDTPLTEYYSVIGPEVLTGFDGTPLAEKNLDFLRILFESDAVLIAGQAASHCVRSTIQDLLDHLGDYPADKVYLLRDCMSAVAVPDPDRPGEFLSDFTVEAEEALERFRAAGMHVVDSTTPVNEWPDFPPP